MSIVITDDPLYVQWSPKVTIYAHSKLPPFVSMVAPDDSPQCPIPWSPKIQYNQFLFLDTMPQYCVE